MELDYKGRKFSFSKNKRKKRKRRVVIISFFLLFFLLITLYISHSDYGKIKKIESLLLTNRLNKAEKIFDDIKNSFFHKNSKRELKALIYLFKGKLKTGNDILKKLKVERSYINYKLFLDFFSYNSKYDLLKIYSEFLYNFYNKDPELLISIASVSSALYLPQKSDKFLKLAIESGEDKNSGKIKILKNINKTLRSGKINFVFDSNKDPIAYYDVAKREAIPLIKGFDFSEFGRSVRTGIKFFTLTIDKFVQDKVDRLFRGKHGSLVFIDLDDGSIISAYSKPFNTNFPNSAFTEKYEPGSIIKCLTMFSYLNSQVDDIFPFKCKGNMLIDGKIFYDWIKHGDLNDPVTALARSCNLSFAKMGILIGKQKLFDTLKLFRFNNHPINDLFLKLKMGSFNENINNDFSLAKLSIGLNEIEETTFHMALISSLIASDGISASPFLIINRKNILKLGNYYHKSSVMEVMKNNMAYSKIRFAMNRVVEDKNGTGRRAKKDNLKFAIKTGTAGSKKLGFDSVIIGFFPYESPKFAFAIRLERAGKAELAGARFLKDFLTDVTERNR